MVFLSRARERVRPWPVRALAGLVLVALLPLPAADAKKDHGLKLPTAPALPVPGPAAQGHGPKVKQFKAPKLPKALKAPKKGKPGKVKIEAPKVPLPKVPKVEAPAAAATQPSPPPQSSAPAASTPAPVATPAPSSPSRPRSPARSRRSKRKRVGGRHGRRSHSAARGVVRRAARRHGARVRAATAAKRRAPAPEAAPRLRVKPRKRDNGSAVTRTVREIVEVVPGSVKAALAALACLSVVLGGGYLLSLIRGRRLDRQRGELLQEVGLLQGALLPPVPAKLGAVRPSVAYRPADGPGAGGDFYDALELPDGRAAFILGDVSGHGREALERTAFVRYTLRAFIEAGLQPREALQVAARVVGEHLGGEFVTVLLAVHDPLSGSLTWASAGHPAPILRGGERFDPVTAGSSPPIGMGLESGFRQTTVPLPAGATACMYTDGLIEARTDGELLGRRGLEEILAELGDEATATALIELVATRCRTATDDMAACLLTPVGEGRVPSDRREELLASVDDLDSGLAGRFLGACGVDRITATAALAEARELAREVGAAVLAVTFDYPRSIDVFPHEPVDEHGIAAASRRIVAH